MRTLTPNVVAAIKAGQLRPLGVSSTERIADLPDVPTIAESRYSDYRVSVWYAVAVPAKVQQEVAQQIAASLARGLNDEGVPRLVREGGFCAASSRVMRQQSRNLSKPIARDGRA